MIRRIAGVAAAALVGLLGACGPTTVVSVPTTTAVGETTTLPTGTPGQLLVRLRDRAFALSAAIVDGTGRSVNDEIDGLWTAASAQLSHTVFVDEIQHQLDLMQTAVDRRRPADADKAALHLRALIDARAP